MESKEYIGNLILVRGLPGSGKSTIGTIILELPSRDNPDVISINDFFTDNDGNYNYDETKLIEAENYCQQQCAKKMKNEAFRVVVANNFITEKEMKPYFDMAKRYNYRVHTIIVENRHNISNDNDTQNLYEYRKSFDIKL